MQRFRAVRNLHRPAGRLIVIAKVGPFRAVRNEHERLGPESGGGVRLTLEFLLPPLYLLQRQFDGKGVKQNRSKRLASISP